MEERPMTSAKENLDPLEQGLAHLEAANQEFENHALWRQLGCRPDEFFTAFKKVLAQARIPEKQWTEALNRAREANRVRAKERTQSYPAIQWDVLNGISV